MVFALIITCFGILKILWHFKHIQTYRNWYLKNTFVVSFSKQNTFLRL